MATLATTLEQLGLGEHQAQVYLALIDTGPSLVADIAKRTALHRPTVYAALRELQQAGLVNVAPVKKRQRYVAESPLRLRALVEQATSTLDAALPDLKRRYESSQAKPLVRVLDGKAGIRFAFDDLLRTLKVGQVYYRYSARRHTTYDTRYVPKDYRQRRDAKRLERFVITNAKVQAGKQPRLERATKVIPPSLDPFEYDVSLLVYGDKVAYIDYESESVALLESPRIARFHTRLFQILYERL